MIDISCHAEGRSVVLEVSGEICLATAPVLAACIDALLETDAGNLVLDLGEVTLFGSTAADLVVETARRLTVLDRALVIQGATGLTARVLALCGLDALAVPPIPAYSTVPAYSVA